MHKSICPQCLLRHYSGWHLTSSSRHNLKGELLVLSLIKHAMCVYKSVQEWVTDI